MKSFLTGLAAGLAIGYLTAPRSGKDTRGKLADAANKQTDELKNQWHKTAAQVGQLVDDVKSNTGLFASEANLYADRAEDKIDQYKNEADRTKDKVKSQYNDKVDEAADATRSFINKAENTLKS